MLKIVRASLIALALAGCAGIANSPYNPITRERLYAAEANYAVVNDFAIAFLDLRQCRKSEVANWFANRCRPYTASVKVKIASDKVDAIFVAARRCVQNSPDNLDCTARLQDAVSIFRSEFKAATGLAP